MAARSLETLLSFPEQRITPPPSSFTLVTDTLGSPALFLLVHFLQQTLSNQGRVIWVSCEKSSLNHVTALSRRTGVNIAQNTAQGRFVFLDAAEMMLQSHDGSMSELHESIKRELLRETSSKQTTVIFDDISALLWSIRTPSELTPDVDEPARQTGRGITALSRLTAKLSASLVVLQHQSPDLYLDRSSAQLFNRLVRSAHLWIQVKELLSGKARDCSGEISVHPLVGNRRDLEVASPAQKGIGRGVLYNISNDGSVTFWARGTQGTA